MPVRKEIDVSAPLTEEQIAELEALKDRPVVPDEENPELTDEEFAKMVSIRQFKLEQQKKQIVSVRLSSRALNKAKAFGKGYTSLLSQILEKTLADDELLKRYL
ncbi:MAG: BrnA antitoxin family protein [Succinivibrionaceae bacterium]|jgi:uncharacterized protein (DUF4415 family)|nr:BrnA antitoxin family protein [Succinivibrionaceae bacterium]